METEFAHRSSHLVFQRPYAWPSGLTTTFASHLVFCGTGPELQSFSCSVSPDSVGWDLVCFSALERYFGCDHLFLFSVLKEMTNT